MQFARDFFWAEALHEFSVKEEFQDLFPSEGSCRTHTHTPEVTNCNKPVQPGLGGDIP